MSSIKPNPQQFQELAQAPDDKPVVMLNLLKFKKQAEGEQGSGADAYARYGESAVRMISETGGRLLWQARADQILIGDADEDWDTVLLVEYPSRKAFLEMVSRPDYMKSHEHREAGLERTIVIACSPTERGGAR